MFCEFQFYRRSGLFWSFRQQKLRCGWLSIGCGPDSPDFVNFRGLVLAKIQLKLRSEYSFSQTFAPVPRVVARLKEMGVTTAGLVDSNCWGHIPFHKECTAAGIQPILGVEQIVSDDESQQRMWFLAKNTDGLSELYRVCSKAHQQPLATKRGSLSRMHRHDVLGMSDNIYKFAGEITDETFLKQVGAFADLSPASRILNMRKRNLGLPLVEVGDNYYVTPEDKVAFEFCARSGLRQTPQHIIDIPESDTLNRIAADCAGLVLPKAPMIRAEGDLEQICRAGIKRRKIKWPAEYETRLQYELDLIRGKNFEAYFIIVADMVQFAKQHMLVGPSRGSAAGSLVCYVMQITEIDPIPAKLMFERFIDITRKDLPDIDLDFPDDKREMVFEYMATKYGATNVAHIGTVSAFQPRSALVQVCKALGIPPQATAAVKVAMIERGSADSRAYNCLQDTLETTQPGKDFIAAYPQAKSAMLLEGHAMHSGVHAGGLLICNDDITNYAVVDANGIAHIDKYSMDALGLLKIDVLGLRTLSVLADNELNIDWYNLPQNDPDAIKIFSDGRMCGIFQFDGEALRQVSKSMNFKTIREINAATALARPGPFAGGVTRAYIDRMQGKPYTALHPLVAPLMEDTYGLPLYQEQTMAIVREIGQFGWDGVAQIRHGISKRAGTEFFQKYFPLFMKGATSQGVPETVASEIWDLINTMGSWQMNCSHTYSYATISYWCAWFKAHHPLEFAAANLRHAKDEDNAVQLLREMVREGTVEYVPFDINHSQANWSVHNGKLYGGFLALKGIGPAKAAKLIADRDAGKLTAKQREEIKNAPNVFTDIFPFHTKYKALYEDPTGNGIGSKVWDIADVQDNIPHGEERVLLGELIHKNARNANEEVNVKKRKGKLETGPLDYMDLRLRDDTGAIGGRIGRRDFERIGREMLERVPVGSHLLVRAKFFNGIRYLFITKWRLLQ